MVQKCIKKNVCLSHVGGLAMKQWLYWKFGPKGWNENAENCVSSRETWIGNVNSFLEFFLEYSGFELHEKYVFKRYLTW